LECVASKCANAGRDHLSGGMTHNVRI